MYALGEKEKARLLKQHSSMLSGDKGQKMAAALKQLDSSVTDLHSAEYSHRAKAIA
jgi:hypothetical protein